MNGKRDWVSALALILALAGVLVFMGAYLVLVLPLTWACARRVRSQARRTAYIALMGTQLVCLSATMARAAWLGALAAGVLPPGTTCAAAGSKNDRFAFPMP
jgi:hypothetical protein